MFSEGVESTRIPTEKPFKNNRRLEKSSKRYFWVKGFAKFKCSVHQKRGWRSAHGWFVMDLRTQTICHRYQQGCKKCNKMAKAHLVDRHVLHRMVKHAIRQYKRRMGLEIKPQRSMFRTRKIQKKPHDRKRCGRCQEKRRNCSKM